MPKRVHVTVSANTCNFRHKLFSARAENFLKEQFVVAGNQPLSHFIGSTVTVLKMSKKDDVHDSFTEEQVAEFKEAFNLFPQDTKSCIKSESVFTLLRALGHNPPQVKPMQVDVLYSVTGTISV